MVASPAPPYDVVDAPGVDVRAFYTRHVDLYHRLYVDLLRYGDGMRALLQRTGLIAPGLLVLDAGCGSGLVTRQVVRIARERGLRDLAIDGFDLTPAMLERLHAWRAREGIRGVETRRADVLDPGSLPASWTGYDLVLSSAMLEYLPRAALPLALAHLRSRLAADGRLLMVISRRNPLTRWLIGRWWQANLYRRPEVVAALAEAGLEPVRFHRFPLPYEHLNWWGLAVEARPRLDAMSPERPA